MPTILLKVNSMDETLFVRAAATHSPHAQHWIVFRETSQLHPSCPCFHRDLYKRNGGDAKRKRGPLAMEFVLIIVTQRSCCEFSLNRLMPPAVPELLYLIDNMKEADGGGGFFYLRSCQIRAGEMQHLVQKSSCSVVRSYMMPIFRLIFLMPESSAMALVN